MALSWFLAYWLRFNLASVPEEYLTNAIALLPFVIVVHLGTSIVLSVPRGAWRFTSVYDLTKIILAVIFGTTAVAAMIFLYDRMWTGPRLVFLFQAFLLLGFLGGPRVLYRLWHDHRIHRDTDISAEKVLIVGAGAAGDMLVRDLMRSTPRMYDPVALIDDDTRKHGGELQGIRIEGGCNEIPSLAKKLNVSRILLAIPSATAEQMQTVHELCEKADLPLRTLPKVQDIIDGRATSRDLREVNIEDLLARKPVILNWGQIKEGLQGKKVMVTGAGGSIGSELCRQLVRLKPAKLLLVDQGEYNLYSIAHELEQLQSGLAVVPLLADVCDGKAMHHYFGAHYPDFVFHAAAYKHVPLLQGQARETVRNNVIGTRVVGEAAVASGCGTFVLISTDKAVNPTSLMGASKRIAEVVCQALDQESETKFIRVRFGNVLGSAGSVVPLFQQQIRDGGPVTVTHPEISRYFMTITEACQLILQASIAGNTHSIYELNMGSPVKISDLAKQMIRLAGLRLDKDIRIEYTGLRPGEKLEEELFHYQESLTPTEIENLLLAGTRPVDRDTVLECCQQLADASEEYDQQRILRTVKKLVPEYREADNIK